MACVTGKSYIIKPGDTLIIIAERFLGDANRYKEITKPDGSSFAEEEAKRLQIGQEVCILNRYPLLQSKKIELEATFYARENVKCNPPATGIHGITLKAALEGRFQAQCPGQNIPRLQCATDPQVISKLTNFTIDWDGKKVPAAALDIGTALKGRRIDILVDTVQEALKLGRKTIKVIL